MSWLKIRTKTGVLKLKPRWQRRYEERTRQVPMVDFGLFLISWWPDQPQPQKGVGPANPSSMTLSDPAAARNLLQQHLSQKKQGPGEAE